MISVTVPASAGSVAGTPSTTDGRVVESGVASSAPAAVAPIVVSAAEVAYILLSSVAATIASVGSSAAATSSTAILALLGREEKELNNESGTHQSCDAVCSLVALLNNVLLARAVLCQSFGSRLRRSFGAEGVFFALLYWALTLSLGLGGQRFAFIRRHGSMHGSKRNKQK